MNGRNRRGDVKGCIKELRKHNALLRLSKKEWEDTFDAIEDVIFVVTPDSRIIRYNAAFRSTFCQRRIKGRKYFDVIGCEIIDLDSSETLDTMKKEGRIYKELFLENSDKYFSVCIFPMKGRNGEIKSYIFVLRDQTSVKKIEQKMYQTQKLALIGEITAGITHEILQPVSVIEAMGQLVEKKIETGQMDFESFLSKMKMIINQTKEIKNIVEHMRSFSRQSDMCVTPVNINTVIDYSLSLLKNELQKAGIIVFVKSGNIPRVNANVLLLQQVAVNLIKNSIDAINEVKTESNKRMIFISTRFKHPNVILRITDTGIGIPKNKLNRIFDRFYTTKKPGQGTGMGLSISREIVRKFKGHIYIESQIKRGTRISMTLPAAESKSV